MKIRIRSLSLLATLATVVGILCWGAALNAQNTPRSAPPDQQEPQTQQPSQNTPPAQQPSTGQAPDQGQAPPADAKSSDSDNTQVFMGTVVKSGDKYMLQEESGKTYDIDHQDDVRKFEGKKVRVKGTLDESGKKILVK